MMISGETAVGYATAFVVGSIAIAILAATVMVVRHFLRRGY